jgi:hypothetical protein
MCLREALMKKFLLSFLAFFVLYVTSTWYAIYWIDQRTSNDFTPKVSISIANFFGL